MISANKVDIFTKNVYDASLMETGSSITFADEMPVYNAAAASALEAEVRNDFGEDDSTYKKQQRHSRHV